MSEASVHGILSLAVISKSRIDLALLKSTFMVISLYSRISLVFDVVHCVYISTLHYIKIILVHVFACIH